MSIRCWNCGQKTVTAKCDRCGCDLLNKPTILVDSHQAAMNGAISGGLFGALLSSKEHRIRNIALGTLWGTSSAKADAEDINSAFAAGAPIIAIAQHRKRRFFHTCGMALGWTVLLLISGAASIPGFAFIAMPTTWYTCKYLAKLSNWYRKPLYEHGIIKKYFGFWEPGNPDLSAKKIERRYKIIAGVLILLQTLMIGAGT